MKHSEFVDLGASPAEAQALLMDLEGAAVAMCMPRTLRDLQKGDAAPNVMSLRSSVGMCLIDWLPTGVRR